MFLHFNVQLNNEVETVKEKTEEKLTPVIDKAKLNKTVNSLYEKSKLAYGKTVNVFTEESTKYESQADGSFEETKIVLNNVFEGQMKRLQRYLDKVLYSFLTNHIISFLL